jgi:hypothetical protein
MTEAQGHELLILAIRADYLGELRDKRRISEDEYISRLNDLRKRAGLEPLLPRHRERHPNARTGPSSSSTPHQRATSTRILNNAIPRKPVFQLLSNATCYRYAAFSALPDRTGIAIRRDKS